jgi:CelD/BcsL family acetyltransferase involved in cellulose biosynthesis
MTTEKSEFGYIITRESFESLSSHWLNPNSPLKWDPVFVLPPWLEVWWREFGGSSEPYFCAVRQNEAVIGLAPLVINGQEASLMGSADVCDFLDFIISPGSEDNFFNLLLDHLTQKRITHLDLGFLRTDSNALTYLVPIATKRGLKVECKIEDVSLEMDLPHSWEEYLKILNGKQRHEVRRKLRRLFETDGAKYRTVEDLGEVSDTMDLFIGLFRISRQDKENFLTPKRESFFRSLAERMARVNLLRIGVLDIDQKPVAAIMCFDYNGIVYLYNSGYDPQYSSLSVGLASKILCIKDSVKRGRKKFDFLKGAEIYKYRLGGKEIPLHRCQIILG